MTLATTLHIFRTTDEITRKRLRLCFDGRSLGLLLIDAIFFFLNVRCDSRGITLALRANAGFLFFALGANAVHFASDFRKARVFDCLFRRRDLRALLCFNARNLRVNNCLETRMAREIRAANLVAILAGSLPCLARHRIKRHIQLGEFLSAIALGNPVDDISSGSRRLNGACLVQQLNHRVIHDRSWNLEGNEHRASRNKRWNIREPLEVCSLVLARCVAQMIERGAVLSSEDVVERCAQTRGAFVDEGILLADRVYDFTLQHHAQFVHIDNDTREFRECFFGQRRGRFPKQKVREQDRERVTRFMSNKHGSRKRRERR